MQLDRSTVRYVAGFEYRSEEVDTPPLMSFRFSDYGVLVPTYTMRDGLFLERVHPGAHDATFAERGHEIRCLFNHGKDPFIGEKPLGAYRGYAAESSAAHYEPLLAATYVRDLVPSLTSVPPSLGVSYRFGIRPSKGGAAGEHWDESGTRTEENPEGLRIREIYSTNVAEVGPVTFPMSRMTNHNNAISMRSIEQMIDPSQQDRSISEESRAGAPGPEVANRDQIVTAFAMAQRSR